MSEITNSKAALKKILMAINEINNLNADSVPKLEEQPQNILNSIESLEEEKNNTIKTIDANNDEIASLKNKISSDQREITKVEEEIEELTKERQELLEKIQETQNELQKTQEEIKVKKEEHQARTQRFKELEADIDQLALEHEKFDEQLKKLGKELESTYLKREKFVTSYSNRIKGMNLLIKKGYIRSKEYQLLSSLQYDTVLDLKNILIAIDLREDQAVQIINKIKALNGPIEYDKDAGTVKLTKEVDF